MDFAENRALEKEMLDAVQELDKIKSEMEKQIEDALKNWQIQCDLNEQLLLIPDLSASSTQKKNAEQAISDFKRILERISSSLQSDVSDKRIKDEWKDAKQRFEKYAVSDDKLKNEYRLSEETIDIIKRLLNSSEILLSEVDKEVINQLYKLPAFQRLLTIRFSHGGR